MSKGTLTVGGPEDPRILKIRDILARNPTFTRNRIKQCLSVDHRTLDKWVAEGLIPPPHVKTGLEKNRHWNRNKK